MQKDGYHEENKPIALGNQKWEEAFGAADPRPPFNYCTQPVAQYHKQTCRKAKTFQSQKGIGQFKVWFYFVLVFVFTYLNDTVDILRKNKWQELAAWILQLK